MGWQPIETAPRDGTPVLVYAERFGWEGSPRIVCAVYPKEHYNGWIIYGCGPTRHGEQVLDSCLPTHWMPLPEPPKD